MIKLVIFYFDCVLVEAKQLHYEALNEALGEKYSISWSEHLSTYDGLKTRQKLDMLSENKGLPKNKHDDIWVHKQNITLKKLKELESCKKLQNIMSKLSKIATKKR